MAEEFQESEVIFQENRADSEDNVDHSYFSENCRGSNTKKSKRNRKYHTAPVNIPENRAGNSPVQYGDSVFIDDEYNHDSEITPPHLFASRRFAGKMAFSVCSGNGRTLKGRELRQVRNSILRMTGFLEA